MSSDADLLRRVYGAALDGVRARLDAEVPRALADVPDLLGPEGQVVLIAFGKAARPMTTRALEALGSVSDRVRGLLVPPNDDDAPLAPLEVVAAGHPLPDEQSIRAAQRALALARDRSARNQNDELFSCSLSHCRLRALFEAKSARPSSID